MTDLLPPLVEAYLADLDRALQGAEPRERAETVAAVREHTREALLLHGSDDETVRRVLHELGPVDSIAAVAATDAAGQEAEVPLSDHLLLVLSIASLVLFLVPLFSVGAAVWAAVRLRRGDGDRPRQKTALTIALVALLAFLLALLAHSLFSASWGVLEA
jgi:hypothetical protein